MSKFLGPIHYWLHAKITLLERIETTSLARLSDKGIDLSGLAKWDQRYGAPTPDEQLEDVIDQGNIHGWLQQRIGAAETRFAGKITELHAQHGPAIMHDFTTVFEGYAVQAAAHLKETSGWDGSLQGAHKLLHNYILEGMPCDQAGAVTINEAELFQWKAERCLHQGFWQTVEGNPEHHYLLRDSFNDAFLKALGGIRYARTSQNGVQFYQLNL